MQSQDERLIIAMTELVSELGYRSTTVTKVIERAGVSRKTFYEYFKSLGGCFAAAQEKAVTEIEEAFKADDGFAAVVELVENRPEVFDLVFAAAPVVGPDEATRLLKDLKRWSAWIEGLSERSESKSLQPKGAKYPPETARMALGGLVAALCRSAEAGDGAVPTQAEVAHLALLPWLGPKRAG